MLNISTTTSKFTINKPSTQFKFMIFISNKMPSKHIHILLYRLISYFTIMHKNNKILDDFINKQKLCANKETNSYRKKINTTMIFLIQVCVVLLCILSITRACRSKNQTKTITFLRRFFHVSPLFFLYGTQKKKKRKKTKSSLLQKLNILLSRVQ